MNFLLVEIENLIVSKKNFKRQMIVIRNRFLMKNDNFYNIGLYVVNWTFNTYSNKKNLYCKKFKNSVKGNKKLFYRN